MTLNVVKNRKGSALLVALLVMGVLMAISLALSSLILREIRSTKETIDSGRAYYAAESGIEKALYGLHNNLPGWETKEKKFVPLKISDDNQTVAEYRVDNTCSAYPCLDGSYDKSTAPSDDYTVYYDVLDLNESITIPLFNGNVPVQDFTVEFFPNFSIDNFDPKIKKQLGNNLSSWDILRWKIFGIYRSDAVQKVTESISDFTASANLSPSLSTNAKQPSWFGTDNCSQMSDRYQPEITCIPYGGVPDEIKIGAEESKSFIGICTNKEAREYYLYNGTRELDPENIQACYSIKQFLLNHDYNYLTLTNMMNPSVFDPGLTAEQKQILSKIYFRVELGAGKTVREYADLSANGYSGNSKQSINVKVKRGSFMPVFNFSLYSTK